MTMRFRLAKLIFALLAASIGLTACDSTTPYHKKDGQWFFESRRLGVAASVSLTPLNATFARVGDQIFYRYDAIDGADSATFVALDESYGTDKSNAYFGDTLRDSKDFFLVKKTRVLSIVGADVTGFRVLKDSYAADATRTYYEGKPFAVHDVASFEVLDSGFSRDRVRGYYARSEIAGSDGASFVVLDADYARDATHAYFAFLDNQSKSGRMQPAVLTIVGADAGSFVGKTGGYAVDASRVYFKGRVISTSPNGFERLSMSYAKTAVEVFYDGDKLPGADATSFKVMQPVEGGVDASDDKARYLSGKRI
ncbi:MAG: DKNYY domain-containing protein [Casimicrobium sp.]